MSDGTQSLALRVELWACSRIVWILSLHRGLGLGNLFQVWPFQRRISVQVPIVAPGVVRPHCPDNCAPGRYVGVSPAAITDAGAEPARAALVR